MRAWAKRLHGGQLAILLILLSGTGAICWAFGSSMEGMSDANYLAASRFSDANRAALIGNAKQQSNIALCFALGALALWTVCIVILWWWFGARRRSPD